jgi:hypothetical protein
MAIKTYVNEVDAFFIMGNRLTKSVDELSKILKMKKELIQDYLNKNVDTTTTMEIKSTKDNTLVQKNRGAIVMTQADSEKAESIRARPMQQQHIFKIRDK